MFEFQLAPKLCNFFSLTKNWKHLFIYHYILRKSKAAQDDTNSYNPWTSQAPFSLIRPVKESNTNYTMTYSKATVRHMSVNEHLDCNVKGKPMGTHELSEFKKMSMQDLEHTLQKVCTNCLLQWPFSGWSAYDLLFTSFPLKTYTFYYRK